MSTNSGHNSSSPHAAIEIERQVHTELVRNAYEGSLYGAATGALVVLIYGYAMLAAAPTRVVVIWMAAAFSCNLIRLFARWLFLRKPNRTDHLRRWSWSFTAVSGLTGLSWGAAGWMFFSVDSIGYRLLTVLVLAGLSTGAARLLASILAANLAYFYCSILPLMAAFYTDPTLRGPALAIISLAYLGYTTIAARQQLLGLQRSIRLGFENTSLVGSLGRAKDSAEQLNQGLSAEIARREVVEAELRETSTRAEAANRAKGEFLATMSHEIRTPMNGILGMLRIVSDSPLSEEQRDQLNTAANSADTLLELINDILDLSKIEADRLELEHIAFAPEQTLRSVIDLLRTRTEAKKIDLDMEFDPQISGALIGDPTRLRQVLFNLLGNAIKFTETGSVILKVKLLKSETQEAKSLLSFTVVDTGIGMDAETIDRLFRAFSQADSSMSRRFGGTGLGLAISQKLVEAMGGKITVESVPGQSATFTFSLSFLHANEDEDRRINARDDSVKFSVPTLSGKVLVVEDDRINQRVIVHFLNKMGLQASLAKDGFEAVQAAVTSHWDAILMDCQLPGLDGLEATRRIRAQLNGQSLPIIALTANAGTKDREDCIASGMNDFLTKPVRMESLAYALKKWMASPISPAIEE